MNQKILTFILVLGVALAVPIAYSATQQTFQSGGGYEIFSDSTNDFDISTRTIDGGGISIRTRQSGTPAIYIDTTGKIGIGTTTPNNALHVLNVIEVGQAGVSNGALESTNSLIFNIDSNNDTADRSISFNTNVSGIAGGGTNLMTILENGNVGIGTASPTAKLDVYRATTDTRQTDGIRVHRPGSFGQYGFLSYGNASQDTFLGSVYTGSGTSSYGRILFTQYNSALTERVAMIIDNAGNVGIADTTPTEGKLVVGGTGYFSGAVTVGTPTADSHAATRSYVDSTVVSGSGWTDGGANVYLTTTGDSVGIGTTAPTELLHIQKDQNAVTKFLVKNNAGGTASGAGIQLDVNSAVGAGTLIAYDDGYTVVTDWADSVVLGAAGAADGGVVLYSPDKVRIQNSAGTDALTVKGGNVGIGTSTPSYGLDVNKASAKIGGFFIGTTLRLEATATVGAPATAVAVQLHGYEDRAKGLFMTDLSTSYEWFIGEGYDYSGIGIGYDTVTGSLSEYASTTKFFVNSSGNVGIATITPAYKLDVVGTGRFTQPVIVGTPTADSHAATRSYVDSASVGNTNACSGDSVCETVGLTVSTGAISDTDSTYVTVSDGLYVTGTLDNEGVLEQRSNLNLRDSPTDYIYSSGGTEVRIADELRVDGRLIGGVGAVTTAGTLDWNDVSNARSGSGYTLLLGSNTNGPGPGGIFYHPFSFEYNSKDGNGNMTQFAIPYSVITEGPQFRTRYLGVWSGWSELWGSGNDGDGSGLDADTLDTISSGSLLRSDVDDLLTAAIVVPDGNRDEGIFGTYDSLKTQHIWSMGTAYRNNAAGTNFGNLYGLAYCHTNNANCKSGLGHQIEFVNNGVVGAAIGLAGGIWTSGGITGATIDTGIGATEVYLMNQNVRSSDNPTFAALYASNWVRPTGATGLYFDTQGTGIRSPIDEGGTYGSVATYSGEGGFEGFSIGGSFVLMGRPDATYDVGIYNDIDNEWMTYGQRNGAYYLYYNGVSKFSTTNTGVSVTGCITFDSGGQIC